MKRIGLLICAIVMMAGISCGPSAEEREKQRIDDSLKLEKERIELLEKANLLLDSAQQIEEQADSI